MEITSAALQPNLNRATVSAGAQHTVADARVKEATDRAKQNLITEIEAYNVVSESAGGTNARGFADEETSEHLFNVMNPIKMEDTSGVIKIGQVVKYTVVG